MVRTLILGATGNTGYRLAEQMLKKQDETVRVIVRSKESFHDKVPAPSYNPSRLEVIEASILEMTDDEFASAIQGCDAVVSCLGHNMTMKGVFGKPRRLVTDAVSRVCGTISKTKQESSQPVKLILMSSNGVAHPEGTDDVRSRTERMILSCIRTSVPPHGDNEAAAAYLWNDIGTDSPSIEWVAVRPDDLVEGDTSAYETFQKPKGGLFGDNETSRSNVAHFMSELICDKSTWEAWKFKMPYIYNTE
eukprot:CAMPEP_0204644036 /NCGR_PEP_ID=MMETSP0718-20130828/1170_1 /ASSEMBLY_ACC=CAM_ASM_000674 /TAXON_ID=230516 /ORGANISM="Chaetoceros curvisetus" /LENGTH=247 /DNA_ID=CAMNT_0051665459 /DNA_START=367 /DNA_END=1110 /DNA_ORIENTATION=+